MISRFARPVRSFGFLCASAAFAAPAPAQCAHWLPGDGIRGTGEVHALTPWDPDGAGPLPPRVVVAGYLSIAGNVFANGVASYDPVGGSWAALGSGLNGRVRAAVVMPNGDLVVGGTFTTAGGVAAANIARWHGSTWSPIGTGVSGNVIALSVAANGDLIAGGDFEFAGGVAASRVARWNGTTWSPLGSGMDSSVTCLQAMPNGDLIAGGTFATAGGANASNLARWDGVAWSPVGSGTNNWVLALALAPNGDLLVGGLFTLVGAQAASRVARWDGAVWSPLGAGLDAPIYNGVSTMLVLPNGDLIVGGGFDHAGGVLAYDIARWDGTAWSALGTGANNRVQALAALPNGDLLAGGVFTWIGDVPVSNLGRWDGTDWAAVAPGFGGVVEALVELPNGGLIAGGSFTTAGGVEANGVAQWDGTAWSALGAIGPGGVKAVALLPNGDLVAGGDFLVADGITVNRIARWDGQTWSPLGAGSASTVRKLVALPGGDLIALGGFMTASGGQSVARWDGVTWSALPPTSGITIGPVTTLALASNGDLLVGCLSTTVAGVNGCYVLRWDGLVWSAIGSAVGQPAISVVRALTVLPNGNLVAGGDNMSTTGAYPWAAVLQWDGVSWSPMGAGVPFRTYSLATLANGDLVAGGSFQASATIAATGILRWDGASWKPLGAGPGVAGSTHTVYALARDGATGLAIGGAFDSVDGTVSVNFARIDTNCPASATPLGAGCASSGGSNTLVATTLPWVDTTFRATGTGLPNPGLVVAITGIGSLPAGLAPLSVVLPQGQPGCFVLATPDILQPLLITNGTAQSELFLPRSAALTGVIFYHQMIPIEVDAAGAFVAITATNSLRLTAGDF